ncbi:hypothetical protein OU994_11440 [Pseudoduganella sp. SL102]|uniref:XAC2610-related protein n=1 Tax=Pseudoduganella sp. SL102 TaxID=2995154 RepID=UPI00248BAB7F|nr:hypothetical protein [Pseudoduganella sp. SL102]WBS04836.1 hypothetical protein OU994_11440 [Pseudoduganella sp. SL102]
MRLREKEYSDDGYRPWLPLVGKTPLTVLERFEHYQQDVMNQLKILAFASLLLALSEARAANPTVFSPRNGISAKVLIDGTVVRYEVRTGKTVNGDEIDIHTENLLNVELADYNFDGYQDFAIHHIDDGKGTYTLFYIYVYSPKANTFINLRPKCGDEFVNVRINRKTRTLTNMHWVHNAVTSCTKKY